MFMMQRMINQIHKLLMKNNKTIAVAESCTGGYLSTLLTQHSGSSQYFLMGAVVYSNKAKSSFLKIPSKIIEQKGAVSQEVSRKMAESVRKLAKADFGIGITGVAGPIGGSPHKPVGTVFIAVSSKKASGCKRFRFSGNRACIRKKSALKALEILKQLLQPKAKSKNKKTKS